MNHNDIPQQSCPSCGYTFDAATCVDDPEAVPKPGDYSTCLNCDEPAVFNAQLIQRLPTPEELQEMKKSHPSLARASALIKSRGLLHRPEEIN